MQPVKSAIIGRLWFNGTPSAIVPANMTLDQDMTLNANEAYLIGNFTFRTDRHLNTAKVSNEAKPLTLSKGTRLNFFPNVKRPGRQDADVSVSVLLPVEEASTIIQNSSEGARAWRAAHPVA